MVTFLPVAKTAGAWSRSFPAPLCGVPVAQCQAIFGQPPALPCCSSWHRDDRCSRPAMRSIWSMYHAAGGRRFSWAGSAQLLWLSKRQWFPSRGPVLALLPSTWFPHHTSLSSPSAGCPTAPYSPEFLLRLHFLPVDQFSLSCPICAADWPWQPPSLSLLCWIRN